MELELIEGFRLFGIKLINLDDFSELLVRFLLNMGVLLLIIRHAYLRYSTRCNYTFSYIAIGAIVFLLCFMLNSIKLEMGFALGLFAIFGIIRYRTDAIPFKQMTYLFVVIGVSVINALASKKVSYAELIFANSVIFGGLRVLEYYLNRKNEASMSVVYENIGNVNVAKYDLLMADLCERTGFDINHFEVERIDYLHDVAHIIIYFDVNNNNYTR